MLIWNEPGLGSDVLIIKYDAHYGDFDACDGEGYHEFDLTAPELPYDLLYELKRLKA